MPYIIKSGSGYVGKDFCRKETKEEARRFDEEEAEFVALEDEQIIREDEE